MKNLFLLLIPAACFGVGTALLLRRRSASFAGARGCDFPPDVLSELAYACRDWHGGQWTGCYSTMSMYDAGREVPVDSIRRAVRELEAVEDKLSDEESSALYEARRALKTCPDEDSEE